MIEQVEILESDVEKKPVVAVTMATGRQGMGVVKELNQTDKYLIRAITRNIKSTKAIELGNLNNVELVEGDLMDPESLKKAFEGVDVIFGNTTPTKGWKLFRGSIVRSYEMEQGYNLINQVKTAYTKGHLNHFIFSSISKAKDPLKNDPAPGHFTSKWDIEEYIKKSGLRKITTVLRPVSYFENFENKLPGYTISKKIFPGIVGKKFKWQTIAVQDIGKWVRGVLSKPEKYKNQSINIAGEELTGLEMAMTLQRIVSSEGIKTNYVMIPRLAIKLLEYDIGVMADWIERSGYGADMNKLKTLQKELNIVPTSLKDWLIAKLENQDNKQYSWARQWKSSQWKLQWDK
ncbi:NmrA/HSCARG family protein [Prochlorococcus sp. MIT 0801]|uniref:NmrA/HSCARG family protein n=1 Tax=Prochlorococcus sp. MIT 0801 TaxID=1501269 RepID=UPI00057080CD|nr:NmrA/HSCARG family protein [Prochlorococcus sp. MIT 0801]